eukprot:TRINITY_DN10280_c0_g2_i4.p1 TRINITY_DN10280_c0_g2~~TRINITY_DN10280_c0_g2_i4.p1  ORF type:complete len:176 (+),score=61.90 TRINITY_DN10280_c0_g2_i4:29-529(+)
MIRRPPRSTRKESSAASDVYKRQEDNREVIEEPQESKVEEEKTEPCLENSVPNVIKKASFHDGVRRGLHECCKAIDRGVAQMCFLAKNCDEPNYLSLVKALCAMRSVRLVMVPDNKELGAWAGLCKLDNKATPRKVVRTSVVVITDYGEKTPYLEWLEKEYKDTEE